MKLALVLKLASEETPVQGAVIAGEAVVAETIEGISYHFVPAVGYSL